MRELSAWLEGLRWSACMGWGSFLAMGFTAVSAFLRFGLNLRASRSTRPLARFTRGWRIHHGYPGILMLVAALVPAVPPVWRSALVLVGWALVLSDFIHHFLLLWLLQGSPEFDLRYPKGPGDPGA